MRPPQAAQGSFFKISPNRIFGSQKTNFGQKIILATMVVQSTTLACFRAVRNDFSKSLRNRILRSQNDNFCTKKNCNYSRSVNNSCLPWVTASMFFQNYPPQTSSIWQYPTRYYLDNAQSGHWQAVNFLLVTNLVFFGSCLIKPCKAQFFWSYPIRLCPI